MCFRLRLNVRRYNTFICCCCLCWCVVVSSRVELCVVWLCIAGVFWTSHSTQMQQTSGHTFLSSLVLIHVLPGFKPTLHTQISCSSCVSGGAPGPLLPDYVSTISQAGPLSTSVLLLISPSRCSPLHPIGRKLCELKIYPLSFFAFLLSQHCPSPGPHCPPAHFG